MPHAEYELGALYAMGAVCFVMRRRWLRGTGLRLRGAMTGCSVVCLWFVKPAICRLSVCRGDWAGYGVLLCGRICFLCCFRVVFMFRSVFFWGVMGSVPVRSVCRVLPVCALALALALPGEAVLAASGANRAGHDGVRAAGAALEKAGGKADRQPGADKGDGKRTDGKQADGATTVRAPARAVSDAEAALVAVAASGDARAKTALGLRYAMGRGVPADDAQAMVWLREGALAGDAVAQVSLATMLAFESDVQDLPGALVWFGKAADQGNTQAQAELARMLDAGLGVTRSPAEAQQWRDSAQEQADRSMRDWAFLIAATGADKWRLAKGAAGRTQLVASDVDSLDGVVPAVDVRAVGLAVERGSVPALSVGAVLLATGNGVRKDEKLAVEWLKKAADAGDRYAQAALGELFMLGWGPLEKDQEKAALWMGRAARQGLREAMTSYGSMLAGGKGMKENRREAFVWIRKAADAGEPRARLMMAMNAMARNEREEAAHWFSLAAENGDDAVLSMLGVLYGWGDAAVAGESEKVTEVRRYAQRGEPEAQLMLGLLFEEGWGVARNTVQAERWFLSAAVQGYGDVWIPLGLFYAGSGRPVQARDAFTEAARLGVFSFALDEGMLELVFADQPVATDGGGDAAVSVKGAPVVADAAGVNAGGKRDGTGDGVAGAAGSGADDGAGEDAGKGAKKGDVRGAVKGAVADGTGTGAAGATGSPVVVDAARSERIARKVDFLRGMVVSGNPAAELLMAVLLEHGWYVPKDEAAAVQVRESACSRIGASGDAGLLEDAGCEAVSSDADGVAPSAAAVVQGLAAV